MAKDVLKMEVLVKNSNECKKCNIVNNCPKNVLKMGGHSDAPKKAILGIPTDRLTTRWDKREYPDRLVAGWNIRKSLEN